MLSLNRYRLRHLAKKKHRGALMASSLLDRTDKLISVILIGNNLVNIFITIVATAITVKLFNNNEWVNMVAMPVVLTIIMLIFAEVTPKSMAAVYPERIAFPASFVLKPLLVVFYPIVKLVNAFSASIARIAKVDISKTRLTENLRPEELRTVVDEAGDLIPSQNQGMLLNILDLEKASVDDILIPRSEVYGIDLEDDMNTIVSSIQSSEYTRLPVYEGDVNKVIGVIHMRDAVRLIRDDVSKLTHKDIIKFSLKPFFVPESTPLPTMLLNFQREKQRLAFVVDEYGDVQGIATLVDLLEEIVGDFATDATEHEEQEITELTDGWFVIEGTASIRDINKQLDWELPTDGPKTLNGLMIEYLENIPDAIVSFEIGLYRFEIQQLGDTRIEAALVSKTNS